jgi:hypothetical protein
MTTLFYPALALQLQRSARSRSSSSSSTSTTSSRASSSSPPIPPTPPHSHLSRKSHSHEDPLSLLSTPLLDSFFPYPEPAFEFGEFPRFFWELEDDGQAGSSSSMSERSGSGRASGQVAGVQGGTDGIAKEYTSTWGMSPNSTWIVEDIHTDKSGAFEYGIGSAGIGSSGSGTTTRIIAAPIVWTDVQTVLTTSRLFGGSPSGSLDADEEEGSTRGDAGQIPAGSSAVDKRLARVVDELGRRPDVRSVTCFDPVTGQPTQARTCLSRGNDEYENTASGVAYLKIEQEQAVRSGSTTRSIDEVWQDVNRAVERGSGSGDGVVIESSRLGQVEGRTRSVSVRVSRDSRACIKSRAARRAGTVV